jgi:uncharacterized protein (TIGR02679 family)
MHPDLYVFKLNEEWGAVVESPAFENAFPNKHQRDQKANQLYEVLDVLATTADIDLAVLAERVTGDAHGLDFDQRLSYFAAKLLARRSGLSQAVSKRPGWRAAWEQNGVVTDAVSSWALTVNLNADPTSGPLGEKLWAWRGSPSLITLKELTMDNATSFGGADVYSVENPVMLTQAVDRFGAHTPPMLCTYGQFSRATVEVLKRLERAKATIRYNGDFDWAGMRIALRVRDLSHDFEPWHYDRDTYLAALAAGKQTTVLDKDRPEDDWPMADLADAMEADGRSVHQEAISETLIEYLAPVADQIAKAESM